MKYDYKDKVMDIWKIIEVIFWNDSWNGYVIMV